MKVMVLHIRQVAVGLICAVTVAAVPVLAAWLTDARLAAVPVGGWGISFQNPNEPPIGNATTEELRQYDAYYMGEPAEKVLYLTFDAGYENGHMPAILDTLKKHGAPATFFLVAHYLDSQPDLVRRMVAEGHTVGNHTATHPDMSQITDRAAFAQQLQTLADKYEKQIGQPMAKLYRPPQGNYTPQNLQMAQQMGYATVFWSVAYKDWEVDNQPDPTTALDTLHRRTHNGAIVLLHSTSATNAAILDELLTGWEEEGYSFGRLTQLCQK